MTESAYFEIMWFMLLVSWCSDGSMPGATLHVSLLERTGTQASWLPAACFSHHTLGPYIWNLPNSGRGMGNVFSAQWAALGNDLGGMGWQETSNFKEAHWGAPERQDGGEIIVWGSREFTETWVVLVQIPTPSWCGLLTLGRFLNLNCPSGQIKEWKWV